MRPINDNNKQKEKQRAAEAVSNRNLFPHGSDVCKQAFIAGCEFCLALVQHMSQLHTIHQQQ